MSESETDLVRQTVPILGAMGIEVLESVPGRAVTWLPFEPNRNHVGMAYAGSLFSVAEVLGGLVALSSFTLEGYAPLVKSMTINYLRPAFTGVRATVEMSTDEIERVQAEAASTGKANYELEVNVTDENGVIVATTLGQYQLRSFAPKA